uniref:ATP synthase subunit b n=1 Tax=Lygus hesperus TaxID=30085 RepID=A0A0A9ZBG4_LYGHE
MPLLILVVILLVATLAQIEGQVVFRPHFLYKHRQQEKLEKENKRRQEIVDQQQFESRPEYNDPYYNYYYYQNQGDQENNNYYQPQRFGSFQPRANRVKRSNGIMHPLRLLTRHVIFVEG